MKKELQLQPNEPLHDWVDRLADKMHMTDDQKEAMAEVSKMAYIKGSHVAFETIAENKLLYSIEYADNGIIILDKNSHYKEVVPFGRNESTTPCAISIGRMIYEDIEEIDRKNVGDYEGYELTIIVEPLKQQDNG